MAREYKAPCGCKIHVIQWTAKRKVVTQDSCPLHKAAPKMKKALEDIIEIISKYHSTTEADRLIVKISKDALKGGSNER